MSSSSDDASSSSADPNDAKMKQLLADWDDDEDDNGSKYVDSDEEDDDSEDDKKKKQALQKKSSSKVATVVSDDDGVDDDEEEEEESSESSNSSNGSSSSNSNSSSSGSGSSSNNEEDSSNNSFENEEDEEVVEDDEEEDEEDDEEEVVVKPPTKPDRKSRQVTSTKELSLKDSNKPSKSKSTNPPPKPATPVVDNDDDSNSDNEVAIKIEAAADNDESHLEDKFAKKPKSKKKKEKVKVKSITEVDPNDDPEAAEMKKLLAQWGDDDDKSDKDNSDDDDDDDESEEPSEREIELDDNVLDHIVLAAPDLEEAMTTFETMSGVRPVVAGTIKGLGIKCARVSFNDASYLEIIAPDPESPGPIGQLLLRTKIVDMIPFHYAIRSTRADKLKDEVRKFGYEPDHISMFGTKKDGTPRKWELLFLYKHSLGGICPYVINWANSDHPCITLPIVGKLKKFTVRFPENDKAHQLFQHIQVPFINVETGKPKISFQFSSPEGTVKFAASKAVGFKFPGFDDDDDIAAAAADEDDVVFTPPQPVELLDVADDYD